MSAASPLFPIERVRLDGGRPCLDFVNTIHDRFAAENGVWVVTDPADAAINSILDCTEGQRMAALVAQYGEVRVYHLHGR